MRAADGMRVLVADDDEEDVILLKRQLAEAFPGKTILLDHAVSAADFNRRFDASQYDLLVFDYRLGGDNGIDLVREVRGRGLDIPILVFTGYGDEEVAVEAMKAGADDYLSKGRMHPPRIAAAVMRAERLASANEEKRAVEEQYRLLFELNPHPMWVVDRETRRFLAANNAAVRHYGYSLDEFRQMTVLDVRPEEDRQATLDYMKARRTGVGEINHAGEWRHRKKDGTVIRVEIVSTGISFAERDALLVLVDDVTQRRQLESHVLQAQKMESIGRLAGGVAHDFNNLLSVITGYGELLREQLPHGSTLYRDAEEILTAAARAASLTRQLLLFSRKEVTQKAPVTMNSIVHNMEKMLTRLIGEDVHLEVGLEPGEHRVMGDAGQLEQILLNLAVNARDAMPQGGRLTIQTQAVEIGEEAAKLAGDAKTGRYVCLRVADNGVGMSAEVMAHLFEPFFTTKGVGHGTGLGLATVYGIVKDAGGFIDVRSKLGEGSEFLVHLPSLGGADAKRDGAGVSAAVASTPRGEETVLVVEDESMVRAIIKRALLGAGYSVVEASRPEDAREAAERHDGPIQLLITDVVMPGEGGRALSEAIVAARPGMKVLFMSGYTDDAVMRHGVKSEGVAFLQKPFTPLTLLRKVRTVLDGS